MAQVIVFQELKSFLRISIRTWLMDQSPCETSHFLAIGVLTQRCSTRGADQGAKAETAGESSTGRARRRGGLCGDPIEKRRPAPGLRKVGQAGRVRDTGHEQGRNWRGSSGWRLLRSLPTRRPMEGNLDRVGGTGGSRSSAKGGDRPGGLYSVRVILSRLRGRAGDRSDPRTARPRNLLAAGRRESRRGDLRSVPPRGDRLVAWAVGSQAAGPSARGRL